MQNISNIRPLTRGNNYTLREIVDAYMAQFTGRDVNVTARLVPFVEALGDQIAHEIDPDQIQDVLDVIEARGAMRCPGGHLRGTAAVPTGRPLALSTLNRYRAAISAALSWGKRKRLYPKGWVNPVNEVEQHPENNARVRFLTEDEYSRLLAVARVSAWPKLRALIMLAVTTGARRGALEGLKWSDVDLDNRRAFVERTKNGESFVLVLLPEVVDELRKIKGKGADEHLVFCGRKTNSPAAFYSSWKTALKAARINGACFHTLRHTHASWLAQRGAQLLEIADSMGHKSLTMTRRYAHLCIDNRAAMLSRVFG